LGLGSSKLSPYLAALPSLTSKHICTIFWAEALRNHSTINTQWLRTCATTYCTAKTTLVITHLRTAGDMKNRVPSPNMQFQVHERQVGGMAAEISPIS
jgi:hypothetical protein